MPGIAASGFCIGQMISGDCDAPFGFGIQPAGNRARRRIAQNAT